MKPIIITNGRIFDKQFNELSRLDNHKLERLLGLLNQIDHGACVEFMHSMTDSIVHDCVLFYYVEMTLDYDKKLKELENKLSHINILTRG